MANFATGSVIDVGRNGRGPEEYTTIAPILPLGADSSLMVDTQSRRWLIFKGATLVRTVSLDAPAVRATSGLVSGADGRGFLLSRKSARLEDGPGAVDSVAIITVAAATGAVDTVAKLGRGATRIEPHFNGESRPQSIVFTTPILSVEEQEQLFLDGWLAIARLQPYRVDWHTPDGKWIRGAPLPFREVRVGEREKEAYRKRQDALGLRSPPDRADWASVMPPFLPPFPSASLITTPEGRLLIARPATADQLENRYDQVDRSGKLIAQITLPVNERIVAVGTRGAYVVATSDFGIETVRRHPWPPR